MTIYCFGFTKSLSEGEREKWASRTKTTFSKDTQIPLCQLYHKTAKKASPSTSYPQGKTFIYRACLEQIGYNILNMTGTATNMDIRGMRSMQTDSGPSKRIYIVLTILVVALVIIIALIVIHNKNIKRQAAVEEATKQAVISDLIESSKTIKVSPSERARIIGEMTNGSN